MQSEIYLFIKIELCLFTPLIKSVFYLPSKKEKHTMENFNSCYKKTLVMYITILLKLFIEFHVNSVIINNYFVISL